MARAARLSGAALVTVLALQACGGAARSNAEMEALAARNRPQHYPADTRFMTGMIPHHAQAVLFAGWAESHGASEALQVFTARMVVGQRDEIATMRTWLRDHDEPVPPAEYVRGMHAGHAMMPGMLTDEQLDELERSRGAQYDSLFLTYMIPHHEGAILMVDELFASNGGAQDPFIFKLASDISADQTIEIERMRAMLEQYRPGPRTP